jgi:hypothetical protein
LMDIWARVLGNVPPREQFELWAVENSLEVVKESIVVTAKKNLQLGGTMSQEYRVKFASGVMKTRTARNAKNAENRRQLATEMSLGAQDGRNAV